ncbi:ATP-binding cassette domain-containing protein [Microbacterium sp. ZW T6_19]|uniref:ATP-binding cassette domain-containing protein n=1 Tax=Microbacterium sp. ZW T6_19 TaxID=3378082 RepID=UPI00385456EF
MTASPDDRTPEVADAASTPAKKTPARKTPARKPPAKRAPARTAAQNATASLEEVSERAAKADAGANDGARKNGAEKKPTAAAARAAAAKNSTARTSAKPARTSAGTAAAKAGSEPTKSAARRPATSAATKTAAAKTAAERAAAAKSTARTAAAKRNTAKTAAAVTAAKTAAAKKAAAAKAAEEAAVVNDAEAVELSAEAKPSDAGEISQAADVPHRDHPVEESVEEGSQAEEAVVEEPVVEETAVEETGLVEHAPAEEALVEAPGPAPEAPVEEAPLEEPGIDRASAEASVPSAPEAPVEAPEASDADLSAASESETATTAGVIEDSAEPFVDASAPSVPPADAGSEAIRIRRLVKTFGDHVAVNGIDLTVPAGSFYGIVGPNGAGKTTTLSIVAGLLRADSGEIVICGIDQSTQPLAAKRVMGVLPDRLRTFDRLTGRQLLYYYGLLRGLAANVIEKRVADLARAFDLGDALSRVVSDYSAGMTKKIMLAGAMIHSPRVLVLDEPFEAVDPVSSAVILDILRAYVAHGGTVILSSHGMDLVERVCSRVAIIVGGDVLAEGTIDEVRAGQTLESRFVELAGSSGEVEGLEWLHTFSD